MNYVKIELPDDFEKGQCSDCPFSYSRGDDYYGYNDYCVFGDKFDECKLEIKEELN